MKSCVYLLKDFDFLKHTAWKIYKASQPPRQGDFGYG